MQFETIDVQGFAPAIQGMRHPLKSWDKSDSKKKNNEFIIGPKDLKLARTLIKSGTEHRKFLRMIYVWCDITAPQYFLAELDTYKIATVRNSTSLQHTGAKQPFTTKDFKIDLKENNKVNQAFLTCLSMVNFYREMYNATKDYTYFRLMRQLMPMGYEYQTMFSTNYETILTMYLQRRNHKLKEWSEIDSYNENGLPTSFRTWAKTLPHFKEMCLDALGVD